MRPFNHRYSVKQLNSGAFFLLVAVVAFFWSQAYEMGSPTQMGPGFFPALLSIVLALIGVACIVQGLFSAQSDPVASHGLEPLLFILASIVAFGFLIDRVGLVPAIFAAVLLSCVRRAIVNPLEVLLIFVALAGFCSLVFIYLFSMPIPLFIWRL